VSGVSRHPGPLPVRALDRDTYLYERYTNRGARGPVLRAYYVLKPLMPRPLQLALRRVYARRQAQRKFPSWPIESILVDDQRDDLIRRARESSDGTARLVNFWPDRKRFAVLVTHDVEAAAGLENIGMLLDLERRHGIVSAWNFVAEDYPIPAGTFDTIRAAGGEVGLHGIRHDGKLFTSRHTFTAALPKIDAYMRDWEVVGFRSPGTHRNAEWMTELSCLYDSSFPDTDPFEPHPGGCCSILPYFLGDLVELPITLAQDHTLWEILRERSIDIWTKKADWLIANHGLINVIVHPDYVDSTDRLEQYDELLAYLRTRIDEDHGWHAVPRDVARWWRARAGMCVDTSGSIVGDDRGEAAPYLQRATVALAREERGRLVIDS
jgi:hypothetical protein